MRSWRLRFNQLYCIAKISALFRISRNLLAQYLHPCTSLISSAQRVGQEGNPVKHDQIQQFLKTAHFVKDGNGKCFASPFASTLSSSPVCTFCSSIASVHFAGRAALGDSKKTWGPQRYCCAGRIAICMNFSSILEPPLIHTICQTHVSHL
jgi:hypothetical protein